MISSMFLHEGVTVSTGTIHQRKSKPNKLETHQKETEYWHTKDVCVVETSLFSFSNQVI